MKIEFNYKMNQKYIQIFNLQNHNWISNFHIKPKKKAAKISVRLYRTESYSTTS